MSDPVANPLSDDEFVRLVIHAATEQIDQHPPQRVAAYSLLRDHTDLVFEFGLADRPDDRFGYRIEAFPEDEADRRSPIGWAGTVVTNWVESLEAADAPAPGSPDSDGIRWFPT